MTADPNLKNLHEATVAYYNMRPILKDMPHKVPRGPTPDGPAEHALMLATARDAMRGRRVLEIACGVGVSTKGIAETAEFVLGTDITPNTLRIAKETINQPNIEFLQCDAFDLKPVKGTFDAGCVSGFFHICPSSRYEEFLGGFHSKLSPGSMVFMESTRATSPDAKGRLFKLAGHSDRYMRRQLSDGSEYVLVENEFSEQDFSRIFGSISRNLKIHIGNYGWWIQYQLP